MSTVPFPQANNIELMFNVFKDIDNDGLSKTNVSKKYNVDSRQGSYYLDALLYLGLVQKINTKYFLSSKGVQVRLSSQDLMLSNFIKSIINHDFIGKMYIKCESLNSEQKIKYISSCLFNEIGMAQSTANRRASTIKSWFEWIDRNEGNRNEK